MREFHYIYLFIFSLEMFARDLINRTSTVSREYRCKRFG